MEQKKSNIRNFVIIAHIDHGKSTLADRFLELTGTIERRKMREQFLDQMELEREKGITIKMQPVRMLWHPDRGITQNETPNNAENFLYGDLTYKIRGILFEIRKKLGLGHKEQVYHNALEIALKNAGLKFESKKNIPILYETKNIGMYQPDFVIENKILIELKSLPEIGKPQIEQTWSYLKGCTYKLALLINFGSKNLEIKRIVYDLARESRAIVEGHESYTDSNGNIQRNSALGQRVSAGVVNQIENNEYILNLIDTPGHVDFTYEVSRALAAVEGAILLVDATQGIQAQTISNLHLAQKEGLVIIPAINKIDLPGINIQNIKKEIGSLLNIGEEEIFSVSAKENIGVKELLDRVIEKVPPPSKNYELRVTSDKKIEAEPLRALIFDSHYDSYKGIVAHVRIFDGGIKKGEKIKMIAMGAETEALELGYFSPDLSPQNLLNEGEIGYIATGIKEPEKIRVGDTVTNFQFSISNFQTKPLAGYKEPKPVVFASIFPESANDYEILRDALKKLQLNDASLFFEPESSGVLGRGFRAGFLGMLHMEIISERLKREYTLTPIFSSPSVVYFVKTKSGEEKLIYSAPHLPPDHLIEEIKEPWVSLEIISPNRFLGTINNLFRYRRIKYVATDYLSSDRVSLKYESPLKEIISGFYDELKSVSEGYASMAYELIGYIAGDLKRLDILIAGKMEETFSQILPKESVLREGKKLAEKLKALIPPQLFPVAIQASSDGRIIARETIPAMKKDVTGYLYGGDRTRKMKLWEKQQKGKKRLKDTGKVEIPPDIFLKILKE